MFILNVVPANKLQFPFSDHKIFVNYIPKRPHDLIVSVVTFQMDFHPNIITKPMFMGDNKKL